MRDALGHRRFIASLAVSLIVTAAVFLAISTARAAEGYSENAVKAAYLYRFAAYVDWPDMGPGNQPFTIAVLGSGSVARELKHLLPGHLIGSRPVEVREVSDAHNIGSPRILYVGAGQAELLRILAPALGAKATLIVTDEPEGLEAGSTLNLLLIDHRVRFEVSLTAAERAHLKISSELLAVAVRVLGGRRDAERPT